MDKTIKEDVAISEKRESVNVEMVDGKILANYSFTDKKDKQEYPMWANYKKVFDTWKEFTDYSEIFFNN